MDWIANHAGQIGLVIFFVFFLGVIYSVCRPGAKAAFDKDAYIPLAEDH